MTYIILLGLQVVLLYIFLFLSPIIFAFQLPLALVFFPLVCIALMIIQFPIWWISDRISAIKKKLLS